MYLDLRPSHFDTRCFHHKNHPAGHTNVSAENHRSARNRQNTCDYLSKQTNKSVLLHDCCWTRRPTYHAWQRKWI